MRQPAYYEPRLSATVSLLIVNAIVFIAQLVSWHQGSGDFQDQYFALSLAGLESGYVWQLLTFQFMHAGWLHIFFNSVVIFFFGRAVEQAIGARKFLMLYFTSGIMGGLVQMLLALAIPTFDGAVVGASAGAAGLIGAFSVMHWEERFTLFIYFFPVNLRGKTLLWGSIAVALISMAFPNNVANAAHLGGIITGAWLTRWIIRGGFSWPSLRHEPREYASTRPRKKLWGSAIPPEEDLSADDFLKSEVDPILDKISAHGIQSLTTREREILERARSKMTKR